MDKASNLYKSESAPYVGHFPKFNNSSEIRLACVEDGLDNVGFRKIAAYIKSIHSNTKMLYIPVGNIRSMVKLLKEEGSDAFNDKDVHNVVIFLLHYILSL